MNKTVLVAIVIGVVVVAAAVSWTIIGGNQNARIGIVRMDSVLLKYEGAVDARAEFSRVSDVWTANIDTLESEFRDLMFEYEQTRGSMGKSQRSSYETLLARKREEIEQYTEAVRQRASQQQLELTRSVVEAVNNASTTTANENDLDLIIAVQDESFILYTSEQTDVTTQVLEELSHVYHETSGAPAQ